MRNTSAFQPTLKSGLNYGLVSYYRLSDTSDSIGTNTATNVNSATFTAGKIDNALTLNGTSQRLTCGTSLASAYTAITMNAWVNTNALGNFRRILSTIKNDKRQ
jgi:hypothetical protein